jgi:hypothetical protein
MYFTLVVTLEPAHQILESDSHLVIQPLNVEASGKSLEYNLKRNACEPHEISNESTTDV